MDLCFLGCGAAFNPLEGNTSAYLRENDRLLLIDCGETVFARLMEKRVLDGVREMTVLISHLHGDHSGSLCTLSLYTRSVLGIKLRIAVPEDDAFLQQLRALLSLGGNAPDGYEFISPADIIGFAGVRSVRIVPTRHAPGMSCFSFVFETEAGGVFYSADTNTTKGLSAFLAEHPRFERIYVDATDVNANPVHLSLQTIGDAIAPHLRGNVRLMHVNAVSCIDKGAQMGFDTVKMNGA